MSVQFVAKNSRRGETRAKLPRFLDIDIFRYCPTKFFVFFSIFPTEYFYNIDLTFSFHFQIQHENSLQYTSPRSEWGEKLQMFDMPGSIFPSWEVERTFKANAWSCHWNNPSSTKCRLIWLRMSVCTSIRFKILTDN